MLDKRIKENELLATEYRIERLKSEMGFFTRNKWKVIMAGGVISIFGPLYALPGVDDRPAVHGMEIGDVTHMELTIILMVLYTLTIIIGHYTWVWQDKQRLKHLEDKRDQIKAKLEIFYKEDHTS